MVAYKERRNHLSRVLDASKSELMKALPKFIPADRFARVALTALSRQPALMECTDVSIVSSVLTAAQLGLMTDSVIGECYLIPFNNTKKKVKECQIIIGYKGLCALAMRSGQVRSIQARAVYEGDEFDYCFGLEERLTHKPCGEDNQDKITHFYCVIKFNNGGHVFNVITRRKMESIRNESKNYISAQNKAETIWVKFFEDMGNKTVLRRLMKFVPLSPDIQKAIALDEQAEFGSQNLGLQLLDEDMLPGSKEYEETIYADIIEEQETEAQDKKDGALNQSKENAQSKADAAMADLQDKLQKKKDQQGGK